MKRQIGLDFGTTTTVVTYRDHDEKNNGDTKPVMFDGADYIPTLILKEGEITNKKGIIRHHDEAFGRDAENADAFHNFLKRNFKMDLINANPAIRKEAQELTRKFFLYLYQQYSAKALEKKDNPITEISTVVTYPAKFPKDVQAFLKEAAEKAGFRNVKLLDESKAAMAFSLIYDTGSIKQYVHSRGKDKLKVMLIDMGAGTTDIAVFQYDIADPSNFEHLCSWPEKTSHNFGGREIDERLCRFYQDKLGKEVITEALYKKDPIVAEKLLTKKVKEFKDRTLSPELAEKKTVTALPNGLQDIADDLEEDLGTDLNRAAFERLLKDYLPQFPELVKGALKKAGMTSKDMDMVILTGGHSQWYFVNDKLTELGIPQKAIFAFNEPHLVVSKGAAWYVEPPKKNPTPVKNNTADTKANGNQKVKTSGSKNTKQPGTVGTQTTSGAQEPSHITTEHSQSDAKNNTSDSVLVKLKTAYGEEPVRLSIIAKSGDIPVKIEMLNRSFSRQFCPAAVQRDSETRILVTGYNENYTLRFNSKADAERWYKRLDVFTQSKEAPSTYTWDIPSLPGTFIFGCVIYADAQTAKIVFKQSIPANNRLLFFDRNGHLLNKNYSHVHSNGAYIIIRQPRSVTSGKQLEVGNIVLALTGNNPSYPKEHWMFKCHSNPHSRQIIIRQSYEKPSIILKRKNKSAGAWRSWYFTLDNTMYTIPNDTTKILTVDAGNHQIASGNLNVLGTKPINTTFGNYNLYFDNGDQLLFAFEDGGKLEPAKSLNCTSSPYDLELK